MNRIKWDKESKSFSSNTDKEDFINNYCEVIEGNNLFDPKFPCITIIMNGCFITSGLSLDEIIKQNSILDLLVSEGITTVESSYNDNHNKYPVANIGFSPNKQKWYGWSHRGFYGFGLGYIAKVGDCCTTSGWTDEYLHDHPDEDKRVPIGFEVKNLDDAKICAIAYSESIS